jgi:hypothetical protein
LLAAGLIAWQDKDRQAEAHGLLAQATGYPEADGNAWLARSATAYAISDYLDSARCITIIARRWPDVLSQIVYESIYIVDTKLAADTTQAGVQRKMLQNLFDAHWTDRAGTPNILWCELTPC